MAGMRGGPTFALASDTYTDNGITSASVTWSLSSTGVVTISGANFGAIASYDWITPKPPGTTYYVRVTITAGTFSAGSSATGTWLATTSTRSWVRDDGGSFGFVSFTVELATDVAGTNVVASATVDMTASIV